MRHGLRLSCLQRHSRRTAQGGFSILEALISVLLFSFAVIGAAGLQGSLLGMSQNSEFRAEAAFYAEQLIGLATVDAANIGCYYDGGSCANADAAVEVTHWVTQVKAALPGATTYVPTMSYNAGTKEFTVTVTWRRPSDDTTRNVLVTTVIR